jgi:transposase
MRSRSGLSIECRKAMGWTPPLATASMCQSGSVTDHLNREGRPHEGYEQQAVLSVHRVRQGFVKARTAQANQIRGLLTEFGLVLPQGITNVMRRVPQLIDAATDLPSPMRQLIARLLENMQVLDC